MSLIKSISGIRGTIGGRAGDGLTPLDIVKFTSAYATFMRRNSPVRSDVIVVGRDARVSGRMVLNLVVGTLTGMGFDVVNIGLATTPTTELAVVGEKACGGIIITASHNPKQWNALKLLNHNGEFLTDAEGKEVLRLAEAEDFECIFTRAEYRKAEAPPVFEIKFLYNGREYEFELFPDGTVRECSMEVLKTGKGERGRVEK